jgi:hypothetical protein
VRRVISGGQTGVDRAALDAASALGLPTGGWCPKGRRAEDGPIARRYPLTETPSTRYAQRTEWNVRDADGTLIVCRGEPVGGTAQTMACAARRGKPYLVVDLTRPPPASAVAAWVHRHAVAVLNVAGPRESWCPGITAQAAAWLREVFAHVGRAPAATMRYNVGVRTCRRNR